MYKYRIIKRDVPGLNTVYVVQTDQPLDQNVGIAQWIPTRPQGAKWSTLSTHSTLDAARDTLNRYQYGLNPGEEIVE